MRTMQSAVRSYVASEPAAETPATLIAQHVHLARRIAWHMHGKVHSTIEVEDLIQIAMVALVEAANAHQSGGPFAAYAAMRIKGAIVDELRRRAAMSRGALRRRRALITTRETLRAELGREPLDGETAARLGLDSAGFAALLEEIEGVHYASLDEVYSDHSLWFAADETDAFDSAARAELSTQLTAAIALLPERDARILQLYFTEELNLFEIGEILGVTAARVCQLKTAALAKIRQRLAPED